MAYFYIKSDRTCQLKLSPTKSLQEHIFSSLGLRSNQYYLISSSKAVDKDSIPTQNMNYQLLIRCFGGKGGFGKMLISAGHKMPNSNNQEACKTLDGHRLLDLINQKRYNNYLEKQEQLKDEREKKRLQKRQKMEQEKLPAKLEDEKYFRDRDQIKDGIKNAVEEGLKRKKELPKISKKRLNDDLDLGSDDSSDEDVGNKKVGELNKT